MSDRLLVATRKGLFRLERKRDGWSENLKLGHFGPKLHAPTMTAARGTKSPRRPLPPTRQVSRRCSRSGRSKAAGRITRTVCGSAPFLPVCSVPTIAAKAGSS
jgi:hypothetical protein